MNKYTPEEILQKLEKTFSGEGIRVVSFHLNEPLHQAHVSLERFAPGLPTAFLLKGLQGTFRRYFHPQTEVILEEYKVLPEASQTASQSSEQLKNDFIKGATHSPALAFKGIPCLDMRGASAKESASSLESFIHIIERQGLKTCLLYLDDQDSRRVAKQWAAINEANLHCISEATSLWRLQLEGAAESDYKQFEISQPEILPYKILLLESKR